MLWLLIPALLTSAGIAIAYRLSPAAKLKVRMRDALKPFNELDRELHSLQIELKNEADSLTTIYTEKIYASRLRAIPVDDLKKYAMGMRLQALKDTGIRTVADLQGWGEIRVSQVRGVGPKSASAIVRSVAAITQLAKTVAIPHPSPPFSEDSEHQLMRALFRQRWFAVHVSDQAKAFTALVTAHESTGDEIVMKLTFGRWLWKFGANAAIRLSVEEGRGLLRTLEDSGLQVRRNALAQSLAECREICARRVPAESILRDFNEARAYYEARLADRFGSPSDRNLGSSQPLPESSRCSMSDVVHVEFGRVVPGPPPKPTESSAADSDSFTPKARTSEKLFSVAVGSGSGHATAGFMLPATPQSAEASDLRWVRRGEVIEIQGYSLSCGFVFLGRGSNSEQHYALNPQLPAKSGGAASPEATGYSTGYTMLSPELRSQYLAWLASGVKSAGVSSFGMLYFYGIERRLLDHLQCRISDVPDGEVPEILGELRRLAELFNDQQGSVRHCCLRLSDFAAVCALDGNSVPLLPQERVKTWELPFIIRYGIGWFMKEHKPIPMDWALHWALTEPTIYPRTPALRCPQEFESAFAAAYRKKFGEGLVVPANKTKLTLTYQPGWPMQYGQQIRHDFSGIPDIAAISGPQQTLRKLVEDATTEIDGYSRYLGRNPSKSGTLDAFLNLPLSLWPAETIDRWRDFLTTIVNPLQPIPLESLLRALDPSGEPAQAKLPETAANLTRASVGMEPDVLAGGRRPKPFERIILFPLTAESLVERTTTEYKTASLIVSLSACVALADGRASNDEAAAVEGMIATWQHLHPDLRTRLRGQYRLQVQNQISLASLKSKLTSLTREARDQLAQSLCFLATVDGEIAPSEVRLLEQIYRALELEPKLLYNHLRIGAPHVSGREPTNLSTSGSYRVDSARLAALRQETDQAGSLLAQVFAEEDDPILRVTETATLDQTDTTNSKEPLLPGLDAPHQGFLEEILRRASWTRKELQDLAARSRIMLDGALERINDAVFDVAGEPVTEGDDPIHVQQNVLEATR